MNHSSERQSPGGSTALWCHCSSRCVLVKLPSFSVCAAAGRKNTSVPMSSRAELAGLDLGRVAPERRASRSPPGRARPASRARAIARRCRPALAEPTAGFSPSTKHARARRRRASRAPSGRSSGRRSAAAGSRSSTRCSASACSPHHALSRLVVYACMLPQKPLGAVFSSRNRSRLVVRVRVRHRDVAGEDVVQRRDVGRALDRRVAAQREDAAAGAADVAEQQLDDRRGADDLHADRVLRPADRVADRRRALAARVAAQRLGDGHELVFACTRTRRRRARACTAR